MAQSPQVAVVGLRALQRDIKRLSLDAGPLNKALSEAGKKAASPVAERVRGNVPHESGALAASVRVTGSRSGAAVRMGRGSTPYAGPTDFGGYPGDRPYLAGGRYLFPAAAELADVAATAYAGATQRALGAFAWSNETSNPEESMTEYPLIVTVTEPFSKRLPSQRVLDAIGANEVANSGELAQTQPFRIVAIRALLRDYPGADPAELWRHSYDVEVEVVAENPTNGSSTTHSLSSVDIGE